jgi:hypothetical protein
MLLLAGLHTIGLLQLAIAIGRPAALRRLALVSIALTALSAILLPVAAGLGGTVLILIPRPLLLPVPRRALGLVLVAVAAGALSAIRIFVATLRPILAHVATATLRPILVALAALPLRTRRSRRSPRALSAFGEALLGATALTRRAARRLTALQATARSATATASTSVHFFCRRASTHAAHAAAHAALVGRLSQRQRPGAKKRGERYR